MAQLVERGGCAARSPARALRPWTAITHVSDEPSVCQAGKTPSGEVTPTSLDGTPTSLGVPSLHIHRSR